MVAPIQASTTPLQSSTHLRTRHWHAQPGHAVIPWIFGLSPGPISWFHHFWRSWFPPTIDEVDNDVSIDRHPCGAPVEAFTSCYRKATPGDSGNHDSGSRSNQNQRRSRNAKGGRNGTWRREFTWFLGAHTLGPDSRRGDRNRSHPQRRSGPAFVSRARRCR
jgi:hypothetical protein